MSYFIYALASSLFACTTLVLGVNNPIHSILFLILVFVNGTIFLFYLNLEFFAITFLLVYVGAIVVLFLFIIMMLDIKILNTTQSIKDFFSYKNIVLAFILIELLLFLNEDFIFIDDSLFLSNNELLNIINDKLLLETSNITFNNYWSFTNYSSHIQAVGKALFCEYKKSFLLAGLILFIAMIGAIIVTIEDANFRTAKQQNAIQQSLRNPKNAIFNFKTLEEEK